MISRKLRKTVQNTLRKYGYKLVKIPQTDSLKPYPYIRTFHIDSQTFDFWIANETGILWYDRDSLETRNKENDALLHLIQPGDRVLEIGCHHGFFTTQIAKKLLPGGFILALEADAANAMIAQAQMNLNNLGSVCRVLHRAGADQPGTISMSAADGSNVHACHPREAKTMDVQAVTGDQMAAEFGPFTVLKLDVEGFEEKVLAGCRTILKNKPRLALELHLDLMKTYGSSLQNIFEIIGIGNYTGKMLIWPDSDHLHPFDPSQIPPTEIINVFLHPVS